jgi:16S rRNA (guanine527-N7)-methyltransferase
MEIIRKYFPDLTEKQEHQFGQLLPLYADWNSKINVISRKDIDHLYERHVLHSLSIAKIVQFKKNTSILDAGTGGGFPGIPLAIFFPDVQFHLIDSIGKKITVVSEITEALGLSNIIADKARVETIDNKYDFVISRAVTSLPVFSKWVFPLISKQQNNSISNGILYIKGGDIIDELCQLKYHSKIYPISQFFDEPFFDTKQIIHIY